MRALVTQSQGDVAELWIQEVLKGEEILFSYKLAFQLPPSPFSVLRLKLPMSQSEALLHEEQQLWLADCFFISFRHLLSFYGEISISKVGKNHFQRTKYQCHHICQRMCNWLDYRRWPQKFSKIFTFFPFKHLQYTSFFGSMC